MPRRVLDPFRRASPSLLGTRINEPRLNREYLPHIAAYGYTTIRSGFQSERSSFSRYRSFARDLICKPKGDGYETDAEFHGGAGQLVLHIEVKTWPRLVHLGGLERSVPSSRCGLRPRGHRTLSNLNQELHRAGTLGRAAEYLLIVAPVLMIVSGLIEFAIFGTLPLAFGLISLAVIVFRRRLLHPADRLLIALSAKAASRPPPVHPPRDVVETQPVANCRGNDRMPLFA